MKTLLKTSVLLFIFILGCKKDNSSSDKKGIDLYISQLRSTQYVHIELPAFTPAEIPELLEYRNDTTTIINFPFNGISSYAPSSYHLGMVVLWTIESIRAVEINSKYLVGRCPSQNPILALKDSPSVWFHDDQSQFEAAKAYYDWWNSNLPLNDKLNIDPLGSTKYMWH